MDHTHHPGLRWKNPRHHSSSSVIERILLLGSVYVVVSLLVLPGLAIGQAQAGPPPPMGLDVFPRQEDLGLRVTLSWNQRAGCSAYKIYRSGTADGPYQHVGGVSAATFEAFPFFLDDGAPQGVTCFYRVSSVDANWREGPPTAPIQVKTQKYRRANQVDKKFIVSLADQRVYCFEGGVVVNILRCSTGASGTPTGNYRIYTHRRYVYGATYVCEYWMDWRPNYGMHSWPRWTDGYRDYEESLGAVPRSHGCIRLHPLEAYWPYNWAPDGTPITIISGSYGRYPLKGSTCSTGATAPSDTWYFPEGYTTGECNEYLLMFNPGTNPVSARIYYYPEGKDPVTQTCDIGPGSRKTVSVNSVGWLLPGLGHSTKIVADGPIVAQQSMFYNILGKQGGTSTLGLTSPSREWYFAEGYTGYNFNVFLILFNPNDDPSPVHVAYLVPGGQTVFQDFTMQPNCRSTMAVNAIPGLNGKEVAIKVESDLPIVTQRSMYFDWSGNPNYINGGDSTTGSNQPAKSWYFAEGHASDLFEEYIIVLNPTGQLATFVNYFFTQNGTLAYLFKVPAYSRGTISVNSLPGLRDVDNSLYVSSDTDILVERTMFCRRDSRRGGDTSSGVSAPSHEWFFAEGYTGGSYDEYILVTNLSQTYANVVFIFHLEGEGDRWYQYSVAPQKRFTLHVDDLPEVGWYSHAVQIYSDQLIVAEQSMYFCIYH